MTQRVHSVKDMAAFLEVGVIAGVVFNVKSQDFLIAFGELKGRGR